jgi:TRAP-type C4-dicarboxylate transport system substrate-binding protein
MVKQHERLNLRYVGRALWSPFYFWTSTPVESLAALEGRKLRTSALYDRFMKAVNVVPVTIPEGDTYTALEGSTVDGFGWPLAGPRERGWTKISRYVIDLPFFGSNNIVIIMNLDKWKALPPDVREAVDRITAAFEPKMVEHYRKAEAAEWAELDKLGVVRTKFRDEADNRRFVDTAYEVEWKNLEAKIPAGVAELRRLTGN